MTTPMNNNLYAAASALYEIAAQPESSIAQSDAVAELGIALNANHALPYQGRVREWMLACFGAEITGDAMERNHRFFEESTELVQANGMTCSEAHQLVDYTFDRPVGEIEQEAGGVMVTLAALCGASGIDMQAAGEVELARIWTMIDKVRAKQAAKPKHSPLPEDIGLVTPRHQDDAGRSLETSEGDACALSDSQIKAALAAAQPPVAAAARTTTPAPAMSDENARFAIDGAIAHGRTGTHMPPSADHWLMEYWKIGQQLAKLGETSAWDNVTPVSAPASTEAGRDAGMVVFDADTSEGGRDALAWYFANVLKRHDFADYIKNEIAADFACVLSGHLRSAIAALAAQSAVGQLAGYGIRNIATGEFFHSLYKSEHEASKTVEKTRLYKLEGCKYEGPFALYFGAAVAQTEPADNAPSSTDAGPDGLTRALTIAGEYERDGQVFTDCAVTAIALRNEVLRLQAAVAAQPAVSAPASAESGRVLTNEQIEAAAKVLAECMDYPWKEMPEQGRANLRKHAIEIIAARNCAALSVESAQPVASMAASASPAYESSSAEAEDGIAFADAKPNFKQLFVSQIADIVKISEALGLPTEDADMPMDAELIVKTIHGLLGQPQGNSNAEARYDFIRGCDARVLRQLSEVDGKEQFDARVNELMEFDCQTWDAYTARYTVKGGRTVHELRARIFELEAVWRDPVKLHANLLQVGLPRSLALHLAGATDEDGDKYCQILTLLDMEEEGDPVAEVERLLTASKAVFTAEPPATIAQCQHQFTTRTVDGSNSTDVPMKSTCMHCGFEPGGRNGEVHPSSQSALFKGLLRAAICCERSISNDKITLFRNPNLSGTAATQLIDRLVTALLGGESDVRALLAAQTGSGK